MSTAPRQHTPGPWHSEGYPRYVGPTVVSPDGPVCAISTGPLDRTLPRMPAAANALLIASAPELLDELERTEASLTAILCSRVIDSTTSTWLELRRNRDAIRSAIAKATGGAA